MLSFVSRVVYLCFKVSTTVIHSKAVSGDKLACLFELAASLISLGPPRLAVKSKAFCQGWLIAAKLIPVSVA